MKALIAQTSSLRSYFLERLRPYSRLLLQLTVKTTSLTWIPMPTVFQNGPYSFIFFSSDKGEPPHIHVKRDRQIAKFWLDPVSFAKNRGFARHELNRIRRLIEKHQQILLEVWHDNFST